MRSLRQHVAVVWGTLVLCLAHGSAWAGLLGLKLQERLQDMKPGDEVSIIVTLSDRLDMDRLARSLPKVADKGNHNYRATRAQRRSLLVEALKSKAEISQRPLRKFLSRKGVNRMVPLWIINGMEISVPAPLVQALANHPAVEKIELNQEVTLFQTTTGGTSVPEWNLEAIGAPDVWQMGYTGQGIVVANMDTGVDLDHPDLETRWRGGSNSWYNPYDPCWDPVNNCVPDSTPYDRAGPFSGHGTQTMGLMVGGDAGGTAIGVAPGARWIAVKINDDSGSSFVGEIHQGFQWLLSTGQPDVVNNSWGFDQDPNECILEFQDDIQALKAAGIFVMFAAGNSGIQGGEASSVSPGNNPAAFAAGSLDIFNEVPTDSARGPSACDETIFPGIAAPGVAVLTSDLFFDSSLPHYAIVSGTSSAAPHVSGVVALLLSAFPELGADELGIAALETLLENSAHDLGPLGPDNDSGYGLVDVMNAYAVHCAGGGSGPDTDSDGTVDGCDNCIFEPNGPLRPDHGGFSQRDTDGDGYGNVCDTDLDNSPVPPDGLSDFLDLGLFAAAFFNPGDPNFDHTDFNGDGLVDFLDLGIMSAYFFHPPGPSGQAP